MSFAGPYAPSLVGASQAPGTNPLRIGSVIFNSSETPVSLPIGVEQMAVTQTLVGGTRVVQTFGPSPKEVTWTGKLFGAFVAARVSQMRLYAALGAPILLSWTKANASGAGASLQNGNASVPGSQVNEKYMVIIRDFTPTFFAQYAEYSITLIIASAKNGAYYAPSPQTVDSQIAALQSTAVTLTNSLIQNATTSTTAIATAMSQVTSNIDAAVPISQNPLSAPTIQQSIVSAQSALTAFISLQSAGSSTYASALQLSGVLSAISKNVAVGSSPQSIQKQGGNAFTVASQYYGDVSQAFTLAKIAGLPSPFLPSGAFSVLQLPNLVPKPQPNYSTGP